MRTITRQPKVGDTFEHAGAEFTIESIKNHEVIVKRDIATMRNDGTGIYDMKPCFSKWHIVGVTDVLNNPEMYK